MFDSKRVQFSLLSPENLLKKTRHKPSGNCKIKHRTDHDHHIATKPGEEQTTET